MSVTTTRPVPTPALTSASAPAPGTALDRVPPHVYFVGSAVFHYLGPAFAVLLFARVDVLGVAWLRIAAAAVVLGLWRRPWRAVATLGADGRRLLAAWGAVLAVMNCCFYLAIDRLPLGTVAAIEFLPVIVLAAIGTRTARNLAAHRARRRRRVPAHGRAARRASRWASRSRSRTPCCSPRTSCSPTGSRGTGRSAGSTASPRRCSSPRSS